MEKSKLIGLFKTLTKAELTQLYDFVRSPYFNKNEEVTLLFVYLKSKAPHFPPKSIEKEQVYRKVFPGKVYDRKHLNYLMNFLFKVIEHFLSIQRYQSHPVKPALDLLAAYQEKKLDKHYQFQYRKAAGLLSDQQYLNADTFWCKFQLEGIVENFIDKSSKRDSADHLETLSGAFDDYYFIVKLQFACEMLNRQKSFTVQYQDHFLQEIDQYLFRYVDKMHPIVQLYYHLFRLLNNEENSSLYSPLKAQLVQDQKFLEPSDLKRFYYYLINYCIRKIRNGDRSFINQLLALYEKGIEEEILLENRTLSPWTFKNIVKLGLGTQRYAWTENFIKSYINKLPRTHREDALHYNLANLNFIERKYEEAMVHLNQVEFSDIYYILDAKVLLLKIYYEEAAGEALWALAQSFQTFIRRNKLVNQNVKTVYLNFIQILQKLVRSPFEQDPEELISLIDNTRQLTDREWLVSKTKALI